jgi:hypothetical protein
VPFEVGVVHVTVCKDIGNCVAHLLADPQLPLRTAAGRRFPLVMARHNGP